MFDTKRFKFAILCIKIDKIIFSKVYTCIYSNQYSINIMAAVTPKSIGYELILSRKRQGPITLEKPPKIPGINVPDSMIQKLPQVGNPLSLEVRGIFNAITADNISSSNCIKNTPLPQMIKDYQLVATSVSYYLVHLYQEFSGVSPK